MFRILSLIIIIASFVWLFNFLNKNKLSLFEEFNSYLDSLKKSFKELNLLNSNNFKSNLGLFKRFIYLTTILLFIIMAFSSFIPIILFGDSLGGIFLLIHVTVAPIISVFLTILLILFAHSNRFNKNDLVNSSEETNENNKLKLNFNGYRKLNFWLIILLSIPAMISIILNMFPLFGTEGQKYLLEIHKYCTLIILVLVIFHSGFLAVSKTNDIK